MIARLDDKINANPADYLAVLGKIWLEYCLSAFIHAYNSPRGGAQRVEYICVSELYLDFEPTFFEVLLQEMLEKKRRIPYSDRTS